MKNIDPNFRERVRPPREFRLAVSSLVAAILCVMLGPAIQLAMGDVPAYLVQLLSFLIFVTLGYVVATLSYGVRIKVSPSPVFGFAPIPTLSVLGTSHSGRVYIPLKDITVIQYFYYNDPAWKTLLHPFAKQTAVGGFVVNLSGYQGAGLAVTYAHDPIVSSQVRESTLIFPTTRAQELLDVIGLDMAP